MGGGHVGDFVEVIVIFFDVEVFICGGIIFDAPCDGA